MYSIWKLSPKGNKGWEKEGEQEEETIQSVKDIYLLKGRCIKRIAHKNFYKKFHMSLLNKEINFIQTDIVPQRVALLRKT